MDVLSKDDQSDRQKLNSSILDDIGFRESWEKRQKKWYMMRHHGLPRPKKPWPWASDLHFPLADTIIKKKKPNYFDQLFGSDVLAQFMPWNPQHAQATMETMMWYDYQLREKSNLEIEIQTIIDLMLMSGFSVAKTIWDVDCNCLAYEGINPLHIVAPQWVTDIQKSPRVTHVLILSEDAYRMQSTFNQEESFIKRLLGGKNEAGEVAASYEQAKRIREGLTNADSESKIVVFETYERVDGTLLKHTFSPALPDEDVKQMVEFPYEYGEYPEVPLVVFQTEIKDKGLTSPRGVPENVASFEASLNSMWNNKHDAMTFYNRPLFQPTVEMANPINLKFQPGQLLPYGVAPVQMPQPPYSYDQEMIQTRQVAEQREGMPDLGMGDQKQPKNGRSATEIQAITGLMGQTVNMDARVFRLSLGKLYRQSWALLKQYAFEDLKFMHQSQTGVLDPAVLQNDYVIKPSGSADGMNKPILMQKAQNRFQMFNNDPFIDQGALRRSILEIDDPRLIPLLLRDPGISQRDQTKTQAEECLLLENGFPVDIDPQDNDMIHAQTVLERLHYLALTGAPHNSIANQRLLQHMGQHMQRLRKTNTQAFSQLVAQIKQGPQQPQQPPMAPPATQPLPLAA